MSRHWSPTSITLREAHAATRIGMRAIQQGIRELRILDPSLRSKDYLSASEASWLLVANIGTVCRLIKDGDLDAEREAYGDVGKWRWQIYAPQVFALARERIASNNQSKADAR